MRKALPCGGASRYAAAFASVPGARPRVGRLRTHRRSSSVSMTVALPAFRAVNAPSQIASKILFG